MVSYSVASVGVHALSAEDYNTCADSACSTTVRRRSAGIQSRGSRSKSIRHPIYEIAAKNGEKPADRLSVVGVARRKPVALFGLAPRALVLFTAGALSGAIAKTMTAPLDRVKILLQVRGGLQSGAIAEAAQSGSLIKSLLAVAKQEGVMGFWKGNLPQVLRVVPYSAAQLYSYECFKQFFADKETGELSVYRRLGAGACAGMTATILTHPLDTLRLRIAVDPKCRSLVGAIGILAKEGGLPAFYRGLGASMAGIAPYMALELSTYDILPQNIPSFARGFTAALIATVSCYPLDTVRRRIQLEAARSIPWGVAAGAIVREEGVGGLYRGFLPNAVKNLPNKGIKLTVFSEAKAAYARGQDALQELLDEEARERNMGRGRERTRRN
ncbi:MAG: MC/SLC25 family protein [bacterium]